MENTHQFDPELGKMTKTAIYIDKVHRCADCPIRKLAIKQPQSIFARIHNWHKTWWPAWKAHQTPECPYADMAKTQA